MALGETIEIVGGRVIVGKFAVYDPARRSGALHGIKSCRLSVAHHATLLAQRRALPQRVRVSFGGFDLYLDEFACCERVPSRAVLPRRRLGPLLHASPRGTQRQTHIENDAIRSTLINWLVLNNQQAEHAGPFLVGHISQTETAALDRSKVPHHSLHREAATSRSNCERCGWVDRSFVSIAPSE